MCNMSIIFDNKIFCDYYDFGFAECGEFPCPEDKDDEYDDDYDDDDEKISL